MAQRRKVSNLLALAILSQLSAGPPMHPYEIATILKRTGKEADMNIKWGSLYTVVGNLEKHGFIEATTSGREGRRPERTVYAITDAGRAEMRDWLRELLSVPDPEFPRFQAALSEITVVPPDEAADLLRQRLTTIEDEVAAQRAALRQLTQLPRVFLVEAEYALAMRQAEADWIRSLLSEMADGTLSGIDGWREFHRTGQLPPEYVELMAEGGLPPQ
jgi:DNA-binding PadR family transcriptional regulator